MTIAPWEQLPMYELSDELAATVVALDIADNLAQLRNEGYTVIPVDRTLTERVRTAILGLVDGVVDKGATWEQTCGEPLGTDPSIDEAVTHPVALAVAEYMCGRGFLLSALLATVRTAGPTTLPLHSDQSYLPEPFPEHNVTLTACWITDEFSEAAGSTMVVPGTHKLRRRPTPQEMGANEGTVAIDSAPGAIAFWDGSVWHGNNPRDLDGERVVLHVTYTRLAYRCFHQFGYLSDEFRRDASPVMRQLLGEDLAFGTNGPRQHFEGAKYRVMGGNVLR